MDTSGPRVWLVLTGLGLGLFLCAQAEESAPKKELGVEDRKMTAELIQALGNEDFNSREHAQEKLLALGKAVLPLAEKAAAETRDVEVLNRLRQIMEKCSLSTRIVVFETSAGNFEVEIYGSKYPATVKNFLAYVNDRFYDGTMFHRVIDGFMIQGGGYTADGIQKKTREPIQNESGNGVKNEHYAIAMARTQDLDSATSQFYINVQDNAFLDENKYCAFGVVVSGRDVVDKIAKTAVNRPGKLSEAQPVEPVVIHSARIKKES